MSNTDTADVSSGAIHMSNTDTADVSSGACLSYLSSAEEKSDAGTAQLCTSTSNTKVAGEISMAKVLSAGMQKDSGKANSSGGNAHSPARWACSKCTFSNSGYLTHCEICNAARQRNANKIEPTNPAQSQLQQPSSVKKGSLDQNKKSGSATSAPPKIRPVTSAPPKIRPFGFRSSDKSTVEVEDCDNSSGGQHEQYDSEDDAFENEQKSSQRKRHISGQRKPRKDKKQDKRRKSEGESKSKSKSKHVHVPEGWKLCTSKSRGRTYLYNPKTKESVWKL
jgi:hypothetical protein